MSGLSVFKKNYQDYIGIVIKSSYLRFTKQNIRTCICAYPDARTKL